MARSHSNSWEGTLSWSPACEAEADAFCVGSSSFTSAFPVFGEGLRSFQASSTSGESLPLGVFVGGVDDFPIVDRAGHLSGRVLGGGGEGFLCGCARFNTY